MLALLFVSTGVNPSYFLAAGFTGFLAGVAVFAVAFSLGTDAATGAGAGVLTLSAAR